jgi:hypothetical protein
MKVFSVISAAILAVAFSADLVAAEAWSVQNEDGSWSDTPAHPDYGNTNGGGDTGGGSTGGGGTKCSGGCNDNPKDPPPKDPPPKNPPPGDPPTTDRPPSPSKVVHYSFCCMADGKKRFHTAFGRSSKVARMQCAQHKQVKACPANIVSQIRSADRWKQ